MGQLIIGFFFSINRFASKIKYTQWNIFVRKAMSNLGDLSPFDHLWKKTWKCHISVPPSFLTCTK